MAREVAYILILFVNWHNAFKRLPTPGLQNAFKLESLSVAKIFSKNIKRYVLPNKVTEGGTPVVSLVLTEPL